MEVMNENSKAAQAGAAMCIAKVVESAGSAAGVNPGPLFQKLCPRICKLLGVQGFLAKGALLSVISSLAQVGLTLFSSFPFISCVVWDSDKNENNVLRLLIGMSTV